MDYCAPRGIAHSVFLTWSDSDQDKALEWAREQATVCACGTRRAEWDRDRFAYVSDSYTCPGCELLEEEQKHIPEQAKGVRLLLTPRRVFQAMNSELAASTPDSGRPAVGAFPSMLAGDAAEPKVATFETVSG